MKQANNVIIEGNVVGDVRVVINGKGEVIATFKIVHHKEKQVEGGTIDDSSTFTVECWNSVAEEVETRARPGMPVRAIGYLKQDRWIDRDGGKQMMIKVVAPRLEF